MKQYNSKQNTQVLI